MFPTTSWSHACAILVFAILACGDADPTAPASTLLDALLPEVTDSLDCSNVIDTLGDVPEGHVVGPFDNVAFVGADLHPLGRRGPDNDPESARQFAKIPLSMRNGSSPVTILLHVDSQGDALLGYGQRSAAAPGFAVTAEPCAEPEGAWSVFAGGIWTLQPRCVTLVVIRGGEGPATVDIPVGARCP